MVRGILLDNLSGHVVGRPQPEGELWSRLQRPRKKTKTDILGYYIGDSLGEVYGGARVWQESCAWGRDKDAPFAACSYPSENIVSLFSKAYSLQMVNHLAEIAEIMYGIHTLSRVKMRLLSGIASNNPPCFGHLAPFVSVQKVEGFFSLFTPSG